MKMIADVHTYSALFNVAGRTKIDIRKSKIQ